MKDSTFLSKNIDDNGKVSTQPDIKQTSMSLVSHEDESAFDKHGDSSHTAVRLSGCETTPWKKYHDLEPIRRLRNEGRELIGKTVTLTEKRDGSNISVWFDEQGLPHVSSHNLCQASDNLVADFKRTKEYLKALTALKCEREYHHDYVLYGELILQSGPTKIEPRKKGIQWVLFDVWDCTEKRYISYTQLYQLAYHYKIPVVRVVDFFVPTSLDHLNEKITLMLKWCKRHRREGIVGKDYENQVFFKEKIDLPKLPKIPRQPQIQLPIMPDEKILRALQHAYDEVGADNWKNVKIAMPIVAKHIGLEAQEHNYSTPRNFYWHYVNTPLEKITAKMEMPTQ
jgi:hypothetical protein